MKLIPLTGKKGLGLYVKVNDEDYSELSKDRWHLHKSKKVYYAARGRDSKLMHRVILGIDSIEYQCDHINQDGLDNQRNNLRIVNSSQNLANRRKIEKQGQRKATSKYKGVHSKMMSGMLYWFSSCTKDGKEIREVHKTEVEAAIRYNELANIIHGEYAHVNILTEEDQELYKEILKFKKFQESNSFCQECQEWLPKERFYQWDKKVGDNKKSNGCSSYCKKCGNERNKRYKKMKNVQCKGKTTK